MFLLSLTFFVLYFRNSSREAETCTLEERETSSRETSSSRATSVSKNTPNNKRKRKRLLHGFDDVEAAILAKLSTDDDDQPFFSELQSQ